MNDLSRDILEIFGEAQGFAPLESATDFNALRMSSFSIHDPRKASKKQRAMRQLRGRCVRCSAKSLTRTCATCRVKVNTTVKRAQAAHAAAGRCTCSRPRDIPGRKCCSHCIRKSREYQREFGRAPVPAGRCRRCPAPAVEGKTCCASCLAKSAAYMVKKRAEKK